MFVFFFFSSRRRHTRCALVTGVQTCALPIYGCLAGAVQPLGLVGRIADVIDAVRLGERAAVTEDILILLHQAATLAELDGFRFALRRLVEGSAVVHAERRWTQTQKQDRPSDVTGKSAMVRVDLGGCGISSEKQAN